MIVLVPHRCKYLEYGCDKRDFLNQLKIHEKICDERTVICPSEECRAEVQLRWFEEHAKESDCCRRRYGNNYTHVISRGRNVFDSEFDLGKDIPSSVIYNGNCFIFTKYFSQSRMFVYAVMMAKNPEEVEKYSAKMSIYNKDGLKMSFQCPVIPIEQFPSEEEFLNHKQFWTVPYCMLRKFFYCDDEDSPDWVVKYDWQVDVAEIEDKGEDEEAEEI